MPQHTCPNVYLYVHINKYYVCFHFAEIAKPTQGKKREFIIDVEGGNYTSEPITLEYLKPLSICPQNGQPFEGHFSFSINATMESGLPPIVNAIEYYSVISLPYKPTDPKDETAKESNIKSKNRQYSYPEVVEITNSFQTIVGEGGFGKVYLGILKDETKVAIKLLSPSSKQGYKEFQAEAQLLMIVHHRNLVSLVGYYDEGDYKALIYEYMANGNLQQHLSVTNMNVLTWNQRLHIAVDAAHGLEYLHNGCKPTIIHRDLKTSNILLNEKMQAKIADFGLSRAFAAENDTHVSSRPAGTLGYLNPEFQKFGNFNKKTDIYSYGIVLFELITSRPAIIRGPEGNTHIVDWVHPIIESGDIRNIIDPRLHGQFDINSAWKAVEIAMSCIAPATIQRSDMSEVCAELKECLALEMAHGRSQRMVTGGNKTISNNQLITTSLELESDIVALARFQKFGNFNKKTDIYSYGIVLFELITSRPAIIRGPEGNTHIVDWVHPIIESGDIRNIIDPRLHGQFDINSAWKAVEIAMSCIAPVTIQRSDMSEVCAELKECLALEMAHGRSQRMVTGGNKTISNNQLITTSLELESDIVALAR
nr:receptor-like protein kinase [Quercus suber]